MWVNKVKLKGDFYKAGFRESFLCVAYAYDFNRPIPWFITLTDWICLGLMVNLFVDSAQLDRPFLGTLAYAVGAATVVKLYYDHLECAEWRLLQMLRRMS